MRIEIHRTIPDDPNLRRQWNALVDRMESPEVFYTHQWALAVEWAYRDDLVPWLLLQYEGAELVGVASLATDPTQSQASWQAGTTADYCDFVSDPSSRPAFVDSALAELRKAGICEVSLANLPAESATIPALRRAVGKNGLHLFLRTAYQCAFVKLGFGEERQALKSRLNSRKIFRRGINFLGRHGEVSYVDRTTWEAIAPVLPEFHRAHIARFLATGRVSNQISAKRRIFLAELARLLSESGWLSLSQLNVGKRPVAWNYGFQFQGSRFWYQPTFESEFEQVSPGQCLLSKMIIEACDDPRVNVVDLGLGAEGYKERFANGTRKTLHAAISKSRTRTLKGMIRYGASRVAKLSPVVERQIRAGMQRWSAVRDHPEPNGSRATRIRQRVRRSLSSCDEVFFYEWTRDYAISTIKANPTPTSLVPITLDLLAESAMRYEEDLESRAYLLRAANRCQSQGKDGYALLDKDGAVAHFAWVSAFDGFWMSELDTRLTSSTPNASLIFDCWTPRSARGCGYYGVAVSEMATRLSRDGRSPWIFSTASNQASIRGLAKTGFEQRFSMVRRKTLILQSIKKVALGTAPRMEVPIGS